MPSRVINPWDSEVTAFLGLLSSNKMVFLLDLPSTKAAFSPAGPPPMTIQSMITCLSPSIYLFLLLLHPTRFRFLDDINEKLRLKFFFHILFCPQHCLFNQAPFMVNRA